MTLPAKPINCPSCGTLCDLVRCPGCEAQDLPCPDLRYSPLSLAVPTPVAAPQAKRSSARTLFSAGRLSLSFAWYDLWVGLYIDPIKGTVYICPLPTILVTWRRGR
jgi:hypothetical protein